MKNKFIKLASAALMLLMIFTVAISAVQAATTEKYTVKFEYDAGKCTVKLEVDGNVIAPSEDDPNTYLVDKNHASFKITITPKPGYSISPMVDKETGSALAASDTLGLIYEPPLNKDKIFCIEGLPKNYTIQEIAGPGQGHDLVFNTKSYEYDSDEQVFLPIPTLDGYDFIGWRIFDSAESTNFTLNTISGDVVKFPTSSFPSVGNVLFAQPIWEGKPQTVTRYDYEFDATGDTTIPVNNGNNVSYTTSWTELNGTENITGKGGNAADTGTGATFDEDGYKQYVGYYDFAKYAELADAEGKYYTTLAKVKTDWDANKVYRFYVPISYKLIYENVDSTEGYPTTHVYNTNTSFVDHKPTRIGYHFVGWKVYIQKGNEKIDITTSIGGLGYSKIENLTLYARELVLADGNETNEITLEAVWEANVYDITYNWNGADAGKITFTPAAGYKFDTDLVLTDPIRPGYTFFGWTLTSGETTETIASVEGKTTLTAKKYTDAITLTAQWKANEYTVTLDGAGATKPGTASFKVTFDSPLTLEGLILPEKEGHKFFGFATADGVFYIDAAGKSLVSVWDIPENTTLYAKWEVLSYKVTVNATNAEIYLNDILYQGTPIEFPYGTTVNVLIKTANTHKVTSWEGNAVGHTHSFTASFVLGAADVELDAVVLPMIASPAFRVDYVAEQFTTAETLPNGNYQIKCGSETLKIRVTGGVIYVNDVKVTAITIPESFFGKSVEFMTFGDGTTNADSDTATVTLAARPELPEQNKHIGSIYPSDIDSIAVERNPNSAYTYEYEFAVALNADGTGLTWKSFSELANPKENVYLLEGLNPGTIYYVYVRVKASDGNYPHGLVNMSQQSTFFTDYLNKKIDDLQKLIEDGDGDIVRTLVAKAIEDAKALPKPSATFYEDLEGIYNRVLAAVPFARQQDTRIAELRALRDSLIATDEFSSESNNKLNDICSTAVSSITAAKTGDEVEAIYQKAVADMTAVKVTYLFFGNAKLISSLGLPQGTKLFVQRMEDITSLTNAIDVAITSGRLAVAGDSMTLAEALEAFRSLDVMAGYTLRLSRNDAAYTNYDGSYEIRVLLPEELWGVSGLQVAYYNEKSGIEVLDTARDGNYLVFTATHLSDFAILGDPTMNLTPFIIALGLILACQLIAIILMLARRVKNARRMYHASFALPTVALTIRFLPANGLTLALVLGALVVVLQIILMYLLLSTDMVHHREKREKKQEREPEAVPTMAVPEEEPEEADKETDENGEDAEYLPLMINEDGEEDDDPFKTFEEDGQSAEDIEDSENGGPEDDSVYVDLRTGEVFGDTDHYEDFIEPAANPKYSLPDDEYVPYENEPAFDENAISNEDMSDALPADDETEPIIPEATDWQYDSEVSAEEWSEEPADEDAPTDELEADEGFVFEPAYDTELDDEYYDDSVRGEPAEDIPQEEPVTGEPADDYIEEEPVRGDCPEYEQPAENEETKKYDGYEE